MAFDFAVIIVGEAVEDDVVLVWHQDEEILTLTAKIGQISKRNLQFYHPLQHEVTMIQHQDLLL